MIIAKPVIPNQFWILKDGENKVGNIEAGPNGFAVKIGNQIQSYKTISTIKQKVAISFESINSTVVSTDKTVHGYPTDGETHNAIFDVKHQVPLWTKELGV